MLNNRSINKLRRKESKISHKSENWSAEKKGWVISNQRNKRKNQTNVIQRYFEKNRIIWRSICNASKLRARLK
jgi:hypothetical protein